jgi:signal transduction histidine kinase/CheY-like chemotaxis protein/HPt (histidine-containing phosphotransfer) domain-containing protein
LVVAAVALAIFVAILIVGGLSVRQLITTSFQNAERVRATRNRALEALTLQLDEETGIRGYVATHDPTFLQPYRAARPQMTAIESRLRSAVAELKVTAAQLSVDDAAETNARWLKTVAEPLANGTGLPTPSMQREGKALVDHFRGAITILDGELAKRENIVDDDAQSAVNRIILLMVATAAIVLMLTSVFVVLQLRAARRLEEERMEQLAAKESNRAKSAFLAAMSHEIRTPMNAIAGMAELLELTQLDGEQQQMLALIRESGSGLLRVIDDILDFSKIEAGMLHLERMPYEPAAVVDTVVQTLTPQANNKGLTLEAVIERPIPWCYGDPYRFRQILLNLIGNALKFTERGGVTARLSHTVLAPKRIALHLAITDTGIGIPADVQRKLFTPFAQGDESTSRHFGGTGLGLSICQRLAEAMGGRISIESTPGQGSAFLVELTLDVADDASDTTVASSRSRGGVTLMSFPNARVLVAEDQPAGRNVIRRQLSKLNIEPLIVNDGQEAYNAYLLEPFDLIITDCHMPNVDGFELTRMIRRFEQRQSIHVPILALTANALQGEAEFCITAGMDAYVSKPASLAQLSQKVGELLGTGATNTIDEKPEPAAEQPVDFQALAALVGEDDATELRSIVLEYLATAGPIFLKAREALARQDPRELAEAGHTGKGEALNVCARPLAEAWRALEAAAKDSDLKTAAGHMDELEAQFRELTAEMGLARVGGAKIG